MLRRNSIYEPDLLKEFVAEIKKKTGERSKRIYSALREYWRGGKLLMLYYPITLIVAVEGNKCFMIIRSFKS